MSALQRLPDEWRYGLLAGLASVPVTLALHLRDPGGTWDASGVALAALVAGYLARRRNLAGSQVGLRTGAVGALPTLWSVVEMVPFVIGLSQPVWFTAVALALVGVSVPLLVGFVAVIGALAGRVGGWLAQQRGHPRHPAGA